MSKELRFQTITVTPRRVSPNSVHGERPSDVSLSGLEPGTIFSYEPHALESRGTCADRVLTLRYITRSEAYGKRFVFEIIGAEGCDRMGWSTGQLFLDAEAVERSVKRTA